VEQSPDEVYAAINNVRGWWSGNIEGRTDNLGSVWSNRYEDVHRSTQKITEMVPGKRVVWDVLDGYLNFVKDKTEGTGTKIIFDISRKGKKTETRFTHQGFAPRVGCYGVCTDA
jgi:hypothetical protein